MERIVIDTQQLQSTIRGIDEDLQTLNQKTTQLYDAVLELGAMWTGPAHDTLVNQFEGDRAWLLEHLNFLAQYDQKLGDARQEYNECDDWVRNTIASIRI